MFLCSIKNDFNAMLILSPRKQNIPKIYIFVNKTASFQNSSKGLKQRGFWGGTLAVTQLAHVLINLSICIIMCL